jgi:hypothetical protein
MLSNHIARAVAEARLADMHREMRINRPFPVAGDDETRRIARRAGLPPSLTGER